MKIVLFLMLVFIGLKSTAQSNNQIDNGERLAKKMAQRMKDSLNLTGNQMNQLVRINLSIHNQKKHVMQSGIGRDSIRKQLQMIENTRDSLYREIIPAEKYNNYRSKKKGLINNN